MNKFAIILVLIISLCSQISARHLSVSADGDSELVSVAILYRHGDRAPLSSYPNDPYFDVEYWPEGFGQLINKGKLRQYNLGQWLRTRYDGLLSKNYSPKEILVESSNVDRSLMSAASNLAGLYTPTGSHIWKDGLLWEPVPIHTTPQETDPILAMSKPCPKLDNLLAQVTSELELIIYDRYKLLFDTISQNTGGTWQNFTDVNRIAILYSTFYVYEQHNSSYIPSWADSLNTDDFTAVAGLGFAMETFTEDLRRLRVGPFFNYLISHFEKAVSSTDFPKFLMLSAHDTTVASILHAMDAFDFVPPEFTATVIWELRKDSDGGYFINAFYKKPSVEDLLEISVNTCDIDCKFEDFQRLSSNFTIGDETWEKECVG